MVSTATAWFLGNVQIPKQSPPPNQTVDPAESNMMIRVGASWRYVELFEWHNGSWVELEPDAIVKQDDQWLS